MEKEKKSIKTAFKTLFYKNSIFRLQKMSNKKQISLPSRDTETKNHKSIAVKGFRKSNKIKSKRKALPISV